MMNTLKKLDAITIKGLKEHLPISDSAYCVSELIKNSIDAGSTAITVQINLTKRWLQVADNGCGISKKNIKTIGDRYYTNRYIPETEVTNDDIIKTYYGKRGEFLSRIVGMCEEVIIESLPKENKDSNIKIFKNGSIYFLDNNAKKMYITRSCQGTTITLNNIFYNKSKDKIVHSSYDQIKHVLKILALINYNLTFKLRDTAKPLITFTTKGTEKLSEKFKSLYNLKSNNIYYVSCRKSNVIVESYISTKLNLKSNFQFIYINKLLNQPTNNHLYNFVNNEILLHIDKFDCKQLKTKASIVSSKLCRKNPIYVINIICLNMYMYNDNIVKNCIKRCIQTFVENYLNNNSALRVVNESILNNEKANNKKLITEEIMDIPKNKVNAMEMHNNKITQENKIINKNNKELIIDLQKLFIETNDNCLLENNSNKLKSINLCLLWLNNLPKTQHPYIEDNFPNDFNEKKQFKNTLNKDKFTNNEDITMFLNQIKTNKKVKKPRKKQQSDKCLIDKKLLWNKILKSNKKIGSFNKGEKSKLCKLQKKIELNLLTKEKNNVPEKRKSEENEFLNMHKKHFNENQVCFSKQGNLIHTDINSQYEKLFQLEQDDDTSNLDNDLNGILEHKESSPQFKHSKTKINTDFFKFNFSTDDSSKQTNFFENSQHPGQNEKSCFFEKLNDQSVSQKLHKSLSIFRCEDIARTKKENIVNSRPHNEELQIPSQTCKDCNIHRRIDSGVNSVCHHEKEKIIIDQHPVCKNIDCCNHSMSHQCNFGKHNYPVNNNFIEHRCHMNSLIPMPNNNCQHTNNECKAPNHHCSNFNDNMPNCQLYNNHNNIIEKQIEFDINLLNKIKNQSKLHDLSAATVKPRNHCCQCSCNY